MKSLILVISLLFVSNIFAGEILVKSLSQYELWGSRSATQQFAINPDLGRAWVEVSISSNDPDGAGNDDLERIKIEGLTYDAQTGEINLDHEGKITTCAEFKVVGRSIFRTKMIRMSSNCKFQGRWRKLTYDNGFEIKQTEKYEIFLIVE